MAKSRHEYVQRTKSESGQTGEVTYDLPQKDFLPELLLKAYSTPTAATNPALPLSEALTKIEVIDGSTVIKSLTGNQLKGLGMIHGRKRLADPEINDNAVEGNSDFFIDLGGKFDGIEYAPDMSQFDNPQIKIAWDYSKTTGFLGGTYDADTSPAMKFSILAKLYEGTDKYKHGYIKSQQAYTFTQAASSTTQIEITRGDPLVGIGVEAGYAAKLLTDDLARVKLDFDAGAWKPVELYAAEVIASQQMWFGSPFAYGHVTDLINAKTIDVHMGYVDQVAAAAEATGGRSVYYAGGRGGVSTFFHYDVATPSAISTYEQVHLESRGYAPFGVWYCPASALMDGKKDVLPTADFKRILLELESSANASTSSTPAILTEYLVTK